MAIANQLSVAGINYDLQDSRIAANSAEVSDAN